MTQFFLYNIIVFDLSQCTRLLHASHRRPEWHIFFSCATIADNIPSANQPQIQNILLKCRLLFSSLLFCVFFFFFAVTNWFASFPSYKIQCKVCANRTAVCGTKSSIRLPLMFMKRHNYLRLPQFTGFILIEILITPFGLLIV